jgi:ABC-type lipoprotein release transport system permease subunit
MALGKLWILAYRDLGRNRRRSIFSLMAVALGLALLIVLNGFIAGVVEDSLQNSIRLRTGHVQLRSKSYQEEKLGLRWEDLLDGAGALAAQAGAMPQVKAASPVLWANGIINTIDESAGVRLTGIDPASAVYAPIQEAMVAGEFLPSAERNGIVIGRRLADSLGVGVGQRVNVALVNADGQPDEGIFTIVGLFATGIVNTDEGAAYMPLDKAQAFTRTDGHASAVIILLHRQRDADAVAAALQRPGVSVLTWEEMNRMFTEILQVALNFYLVLDLIVILIVAVVIANTLLMAVFERIREMGILAALGMKGRQIMFMLLLEAFILGLAGVVVGIALGSAGVAYLAKVGIYIGEGAASAAGSIPLGTTMYARLVPGSIASLSLWTLAIVLLASLYPAWFAARLQPVEALHAS